MCVSRSLAVSDDTEFAQQKLPASWSAALAKIDPSRVATQTTFDLSDDSFSGLPQSEVQPFMIFLAGYLLQYPFIYILPNVSNAELDTAISHIEVSLLQLIAADEQG